MHSSTSGAHGAPNPTRFNKVITGTQTVSWMLLFPVMVFAMREIIDPGTTGFVIELKRLLAASIICWCGYRLTSICVTGLAPLAARGSGLALAAALGFYAVLFPTIVSLGYFGLAHKEIAKSEAQQKCGVIRAHMADLDRVQTAKLALRRSIAQTAAESMTRGTSEAETGRESGKKSVKGKPQPVANGYIDMGRMGQQVATAFDAGAGERAAKLREIEGIVEDCERTVADPKKWASDGAARVLALYDRAGALSREIAVGAPVEMVQSLIQALRKGGAGSPLSPALLGQQAVHSGQAEALEAALSRLPRDVDPLPPATMAAGISAAYEEHVFARHYPLFLVALLCEGGSLAAFVMAFVAASIGESEAERRRMSAGTHGAGDNRDPPLTNGRDGTARPS